MKNRTQKVVFPVFPPINSVCIARVRAPYTPHMISLRSVIIKIDTILFRFVSTDSFVRQEYREGKMPTMASIGVPPAIRERLGSLRLPIHTPQALLSRDPVQLSQEMNLTQTAVWNLRALVADALTAAGPGGGGGRTTTAMVATVSQSIDHLLLQLDADPPDDANENEKQQNNVVFHETRRPPPMIAGAVTALDACLYSALRASHQTTCVKAGLTTGSQRLDDLLTTCFERVDAACVDVRIHPDSLLPALLRDGIGKKRSRERMDSLPHNNMYTHMFGSNSARKAMTERTTGGISSFMCSSSCVTEVCGPPASGKTQLALTLAVHAAIQGKTVHYLASGCGHGSLLPLARRVRQILLASSFHGSTLQEGAMMDVLNRVHFTVVSDGHAAMTALEHVMKSTTTTASMSYHNADDSDATRMIMPCLIVLDSVSGCLSSNLYADSDGHIGGALANEVGLLLRRLARTKQASVFVTNGTVTLTGNTHNSNTQFKPALGQFWRAADLRLFLCPILSEDGHDDSNSSCHPSFQLQASMIPGLCLAPMKRIRATVEHHGSMRRPSDRNGSELSVEFAIDKTGIIDIPSHNAN